MLPVSTFLGLMLQSTYYYPRRQPTILEVVEFYLNRIDILFLIVTVTTATLTISGFGNKDLMYKASVYLFIISMILLFASVLQLLFTYPWTS